MDTVTAITNRRSIRKFLSRALPDGDLRTILEAGRQAPSAANRQPWHFVVVREDAQRRRLAEACSGQMWLADAGAIIAGVGKPDVNEKWYPVDVAIAMQNMIVAATALGYGTCWIGAFEEAKVKEVLGIPEEMRVVALTPVGAPDDKPDRRPRMGMEEFVSLDRYGQKMK